MTREEREQLKKKITRWEEKFNELKAKISSGFKLTEEERFDYLALDEFFNGVWWY
jgi:predicted  nucleic acid-binding Zn-ribbon protein